MAVDTATFAISLEDGVSGAAESAAKALEGLRASIFADTKALAQLQRAQKNLKGSSNANVEQLKKLQDQITATKERIAQAQSAVIDLGGTLEKGRKPAGGFAEAMARAQAQAQGLGGPLGGVAGRLGAIKSLLTGGGAVSLGLVATAAALALVAGAAVTAGASLLKYGIAQADARRSELLRLEGLTKLRSLWVTSAGSATEMQAAIDRVSASSALSRSEIAGYATNLYKAGLRGDNLSQALEVAALKASVLGDAQAEAWNGTAAGIALAGGSVRKFAEQTRARLGGIAAKQMLSLTVISSKLSESFSTLFSGLKIEGMLSALKSVADLFAESTATGKALRVVLGAVFQPFVGSIESTAIKAKRFFQGMVIGALDITNALASAALWVKKSLGLSFKKTMGDATGALTLGKIAAYGVAAALGAVALAMTTLVSPVLLVVSAFSAITLAIADTVSAFRDIKWGELGEFIVQGIARGINKAEQWAIDAVARLADKTIGAFKGALGIRSPSREFAKLGIQLPRGVEQGLDEGQPSLDKRVAAIVPPPQPGTASTRPTPQRPTSTRPAIHIEAINIQTTASNAPSIARDIRSALEDILSGVQVQLGVQS